MHIKASAFPELRRVFSGYLHEDVLAESGSVDAALRTFWADAAPDERRRFQHEVVRLLALTAPLELDDMRDLVHQLGSRWIPPSREALVALLTSASNFPEPSPR
jgi:contact-dependent growth inhibition (CDI) system CdiI-like immunity protein